MSSGRVGLKSELAIISGIIFGIGKCGLCRARNFVVRTGAAFQTSILDPDRFLVCNMAGVRFLTG
jgi:hypothetical protein